MPPRPFPFRLKVGTDICYIPRIRSILKTDANGEGDRPLGRFLSKILTAPERDYFWHRFKDEDAAYKDINKVASFLAGRWAAKEACRKACTHLGTSNGLHSIIILPIDTSQNLSTEQSVPPKGLILRHTLVREKKAVDSTQTLIRKTVVGTSPFSINNVDGQFCEISISHEHNGYATAVALVPALPDSWHGETEAENGEPDNIIVGGGIGEQSRTDPLKTLEQEMEKNARLESLLPKNLKVPDVEKIREHILLLKQRNQQLEHLARADRLQNQILRNEKRLIEAGFKIKKAASQV